MVCKRPLCLLIMLMDLEVSLKINIDVLPLISFPTDNPSNTANLLRPTWIVIWMIHKYNGLIIGLRHTSGKSFISVITLINPLSPNDAIKGIILHP